MTARPVNPGRIEVEDRTRVRPMVLAVRLIRRLVAMGRSIATFIRNGNEKAR